MISRVKFIAFDFDLVLCDGKGNLVTDAVEILQKSHNLVGKNNTFLVSLNHCAGVLCKNLGIDDMFETIISNAPNPEVGNLSKAFLIESVLGVSVKNCILFDDNATNLRNFRQWGGQGILVENMNLMRAWKKFQKGEFFENKYLSKWSKK